MNHLESRIQIVCVKWFRMQFPKLARLLISIPNGGKRNAFEATIMKREGIVAGAADLFLFYPARGYHGLAIEMKTKTGYQSPSQKEWQRCVEEQGYKYIICRSFEQFRDETKRYFTGK